ncbi:hypothetical protein DETS111669_23000 [Delftia tsuruhatensis]
MQTLRNCLMLPRLALAWFMLALAMAVASPIVHPRSLEVVCTGNGSMQVVVLDDEGQASAGTHHSLDCPLCLVVTPALLHPSPEFEQPQPLGLAVQPVESARIAALVGAKDCFVRVALDMPEPLASTLAQKDVLDQKMGCDQDISRLRRQLDVMHELSAILGERIAAF